DSSDDKGSDDKGDRSRVCGQIDAISSSSITVDGQVYAITSGTEFESNSGESLSYLAFSVGDFVKLDIRSGSLHEVEFETSASCRSSKVVSSNQKKDQNSSTLRRTRLKTKLTASAGVSTSARGQAQYIARAKKGKSRDQFKVKVLVPVPSTNPVLTDSGQASLLNLSVYIQRGVDTLAICTLEFDEVENSMAEYKIDLKEHDGSFRAKKGDCDIDPAQSGTQSGIPSFNSGDTIMVVTEDLSGLLEGQL
ncbi:MAG: hypothetical protein KDD62_08980, partial [Bdellovibrionales bacterium]|nr:hypothetical protein [Bdellovibrionales bacterium]